MMENNIGVLKIKDGIYVSMNRSFKTEFVLKKNGQDFFLYGWDRNVSSGKIYYYAEGKKSTETSLSFRNFIFSKKAYQLSNLEDFISDTYQTIPTYNQYKYVSNIIIKRNVIECDMITTSHESQGDKFYFILLE